MRTEMFVQNINHTLLGISFDIFHFELFEPYDILLDFCRFTVQQWTDELLYNENVKMSRTYLLRMLFSH
ncbi:hypothetical protein T01_321 [Trichinella spiralis]|uniref:Uncharacterized protein n=1 Tax=Trichinella spiralis TaxID=6334 RepID=A0A0V1C261_TRISP|nr:hypothetical protein T01_321 [Trichinella spiralis]